MATHASGRSWRESRTHMERKQDTSAPRSSCPLMSSSPSQKTRTETKSSSSPPRTRAWTARTPSPFHQRDCSTQGHRRDSRSFPMLSCRTETPRSPRKARRTRARCPRDRPLCYRRVPWPPSSRTARRSQTRCQRPHLFRRARLFPARGSPARRGDGGAVQTTATGSGKVRGWTGGEERLR